MRMLGDVEMAQAMNYMRASGLKRVLIINFSGRKLAYKRGDGIRRRPIGEWA